MNYKKRLIFPIDTNDPMNGIFSYLRKNNLLHLVYSYENSIFPGNSKAIALIENNTKTWYTSTGNINEYFELGILNYEVFVNGYGMMANANDDNVQRNWIVSCTDTSVERVIAHEINNNVLCPGATGLTHCGFPDKKAFNVTNPMKCNRIKYMNSGLDSNNEHFISLSGFEIFGEIYIPIVITCTHKNTHYPILVIFIFLLS